MQYGNSTGNFLNNIPHIVKNLLIINGLMFLATLAFRPFMITNCALFFPESPMFKPLQLFTHMFMHSDFWHLFFNMWMLFMLGVILERHWGPKRFLIYYLATGFGAAFFYELTLWFQVMYYESQIDPAQLEYMKSLLVQEKVLTEGSNAIMQWTSIMCTPMLGASGAVYGLLMAFGMLFPNVEFGIIFLPVRIKAKWMVIILGAVALWSGIRPMQGDNIAHFAHLGGLIFGYLLMRHWQKKGGNHTFY